MSNGTEKFGGFEQFAGTSISRLVDKISITRGSQFNFPTAMHRKNKLSRYKAVRLFHNKKERKIGLEFIAEPQPDDGSLKLIPSGEEGQYGAFIVAKSFFFLNDLQPAKLAGRYNYEKISMKQLGAERQGVLYVIDLNEKGTDKMKSIK